MAVSEDACLEAIETARALGYRDGRAAAYQEMRAACKHPTTYTQGSLGEFCTVCNQPVD